MMEAATEQVPAMDDSMASLFKILEEKYGYERADLEDMLAAIQSGNTFGEFFGYTHEVYNAIEDIALVHYRARRYDTALSVFNYVRNLSQDTRVSAIRGSAACHQALKDYPVAIAVYRLALWRDPNDLLSQVYCGECLCQVGAVEEGFALLELAVATPDLPAKMAPYVARARAILDAQRKNVAAGITPQGVAPQAVQTQPAPAQPAPAAAPVAAAAEAKADATPNDVVSMLTGGQEETMEQALEDPAVAEQIEQLTELYRRGGITLKEIAGFTDDQFNGGYAAACKMLELGKATDALQLVGWLLWLDPRQARLYHLAGLCTHHLQLWCLADFLYAQALRYDANNPITMIYQGEVKLMMEERRQGLELVRQGLALNPVGPDGPEAHKRGQILLKQFGEQHEPPSADAV